MGDKLPPCPQTYAARTAPKVHRALNHIARPDKLGGFYLAQRRSQKYPAQFFAGMASVLRLSRHCDDLHSVISTIAQPYSHLVSFSRLITIGGVRYVAVRSSPAARDNAE
jgi:hypothetical protein